MNKEFENFKKLKEWFREEIKEGGQEEVIGVHCIFGFESITLKIELDHVAWRKEYIIPLFQNLIEAGFVYIQPRIRDGKAISHLLFRFKANTRPKEGVFSTNQEDPVLADQDRAMYKDLAWDVFNFFEEVEPTLTNKCKIKYDLEGDYLDIDLVAKMSDRIKKKGNNNE